MTTTFKVVFSEDAELDFELIFDFLFESYLSFDEDIETAIEQAEKKTQSIRKSADKLARHPFRGTLHDDMLPDRSTGVCGMSQWGGLYIGLIFLKIRG